MKRQTKLTSQEQEQLAEVKSQPVTAREFGSVEELMRHDAGQTAVPPAIAERLAQSIQTIPPPERSWWQRVLGR
jgi:hypothetical protein